MVTTAWYVSLNISGSGAQALYSWLGKCRFIASIQYHSLDNNDALDYVSWELRLEAINYSRVPSPIKKYLYIISIYVAHGLNIEQKSHAPSAIKCVI